MYELIVILCRYLFVFYGVYFLWQGVVYILEEREIKKTPKNSHTVAKQRVATIFMHLNAYLILAYLPGTFSFDFDTLLIGAGGLAFLVCGQFAVEKIYKKSCPLMWNGVFFLLDTGLIMLQRIDPEFAQKQLIWFFVGFAAMLVIPFALKFIPKFETLEKAYLFSGLFFVILPTLFGITKFGAVNWIQIYNIQFQPSELVKFLFVFYLASVFGKKLPLRKLVLPAAMSAMFVAILTYQRDLGGALIFFMTYMLMQYISTGNIPLFISGIAAFSAASVISYQIFPHIRVRVAAWQNPWADTAGSGYQIVQSLFAIGTWGLFGSGLTRGHLAIPVIYSDFIFSAICEEFGGIFGICLIGVFIMIFYRGTHIALRCKRRHYAMLASGFTCILAFQTFLILGGVTKLIPLTGVTLPFVSYGGSSILVSVMMVGILQWIYSYYEK